MRAYLVLLLVLVSCAPNLMSSGKAIDYASRGFAPPHNIFDSDKPIFSVPASVEFESGDLSVDIRVDLNISNGFVYKRGYLRTSAGWKALDFSQSSSPWVKNNLSALVSVPLSDLDLEGPNYIVGYACERRGNSWKCGCASPSLCNRWMLQSFTLVRSQPTVGTVPVESCVGPSVPNHNVKESVSFANSLEYGTGSMDDVCVNNVLSEYYCLGSLVKNQSFICPDSCNDGRCVASAPISQSPLQLSSDTTAGSVVFEKLMPLGGDEGVISSVAIDSQGNKYFVGTFSVNMSFDNIFVRTWAEKNNWVYKSMDAIDPAAYIKPTDVFIAKLGYDGSWKWVKTVEGPFIRDPEASNWEMPAIANAGKVFVDSNDDVYFFGYSGYDKYSGGITFSGSSLSISGPDMINYVAKISSDGRWLWAKKTDGVGSPFFREYRYSAGDMSSSSPYFKDNKFYFTGYKRHNQELIVHYTVDSQGVLANSSAYDPFVAAMDLDGTWVINVIMPLTKNDRDSRVSFSSILVSPNGDKYFSGAFYGNFFRFNVSPSAFDLRNSTEVFLGNVSIHSEAVFNTSMRSRCYTISGGNTACSYSSGPNPDAIDVVVAKQSASGNWDWAKISGINTDMNSMTSNGYSKFIILVDSVLSNDGLYILGQYSNTTGFMWGDSVMPIDREYAIRFVSKLDLSGNILWTKVLPDGVSPNQLIIDSSNNVVVVGNVATTKSFSLGIFNFAPVKGILYGMFSPQGAWLSAKVIPAVDHSIMVSSIDSGKLYASGITFDRIGTSNSAKNYRGFVWQLS